MDQEGWGGGGCGGVQDFSCLLACSSCCFLQFYQFLFVWPMHNHFFSFFVP